MEGAGPPETGAVPPPTMVSSGVRVPAATPHGVHVEQWLPMHNTAVVWVVISPQSAGCNPFFLGDVYSPGPSFSAQ